MSGTPMPKCTINHSDDNAATQITAAFASTLPIISSNALTGITSKCSIVPRSRSRITAAPVNKISNIHDIEPICEVGMNHELSPLGL